MVKSYCSYWSMEMKFNQKEEPKSPMKKPGFTLAEIMVAIGVLGVLSAMLIPTIAKIAPDKNKVMFKKAYYTLERAADNMINDDNNYPSNAIDTLANVIRGFNYTTATTNTSNKFCYFLSDELNTVGTVSCPATNATGTGTFTTTDGIKWTVYIPISDATTTGNANLAANQTASSQFPLNSTLYTTLITVDVNPASNSSNCSEDALSNPTVSACSAGTSPDTFRINIRYDGKLQIPTTDTNATNILSNPTNNQ